MRPATKAKRTAWAIVDNLLQGFFDVGQPFIDCEDAAKEAGREHPDTCPECRRLYKALKQIKEMAHHRGEDWRNDREGTSARGEVASHRR